MTDALARSKQVNVALDRIGDTPQSWSAPLMSHADVLAWEARLGLTVKRAALLLGLSPRTYERYHFGYTAMPEPTARLALAIEQQPARLALSRDMWRQLAEGKAS